jgi:hypothetical protein
MKKTRAPSLVCEHCAKNIAAFGHPCTVLIDLVCAYYRNSQLLDYDENYDKDTLVLKQPAMFMESKGYIVSTESDQTKVSILPNFSRCTFDEDSNKFCWCGR